MSFYSSEEFILDTKIYKVDAIKKAAKGYAEYCDVRIAKRDGSKLTLAVHINDKFHEHNEHIKSELLNYILGLSISIREG